MNCKNMVKSSAWGSTVILGDFRLQSECEIEYE